MPTRYDKEFKQNIINLYKQGESAAQLAREYGVWNFWCWKVFPFQKY